MSQPVNHVRCQSSDHKVGATRWKIGPVLGLGSESGPGEHEGAATERPSKFFLRKDTRALSLALVPFYG
jgi:hypothetical protein